MLKHHRRWRRTAPISLRFEIWFLNKPLNSCDKKRRKKTLPYFCWYFIWQMANSKMFRRLCSRYASLPSSVVLSDPHHHPPMCPSKWHAWSSRRNIWVKPHHRTLRLPSEPHQPGLNSFHRCILNDGTSQRSLPGGSCSVVAFSFSTDFGRDRRPVLPIFTIPAVPILPHTPYYIVFLW